MYMHNFFIVKFNWLRKVKGVVLMKDNNQYLPTYTCTMCYSKSQFVVVGSHVLRCIHYTKSNCYTHTCTCSLIHTHAHTELHGITLRKASTVFE